METKSSLKKVTMIIFAFLVIGFVFFAGCKKNDTVTNPPATTQDPQATQDAATSIGGSLAINNGGILDQVADLLNTPTAGGILNKAINPDPNSISAATFSYDSTTGWWTVNIDRTRSGLVWYSHYTREYMHQFLNSSGAFQKKYIDNGDTAYTVNHKIVGGTGTFYNLWLAHKLTGLSCAWTGTNTNTPTVTINTSAPYTRSAIDTIFGAGGGVRTLDHTLTVNFINVIGPRGTGLDWWLKTSGTLTGHYHAVVTFQKGTTYNEHTIDRDFTVTLGGTNLVVGEGGKTFQVDPNTGGIQQ
jgi:hypothetical protein